ncbi:hypothetical protein HPP92_023740 [Vanilla planifolia]|uniref:Uncharacterized protein n=1 Tax=Vanilla planifolia TaxID=51239 RepID=A0A835PTR2_VANPL|nr:hypothetical protein HPP92_023740 [Vanilla planifolia]
MALQRLEEVVEGIHMEVMEEEVMGVAAMEKVVVVMGKVVEGIRGDEAEGVMGKTAVVIRSGMVVKEKVVVGKEAVVIHNGMVVQVTGAVVGEAKAMVVEETMKEVVGVMVMLG